MMDWNNEPFARKQQGGNLSRLHPPERFGLAASLCLFRFTLFLRDEIEHQSGFIARFWLLWRQSARGHPSEGIDSDC